MGMSISERMAMQARAAAASHVKPITAPKKVNTVSAVNRAAKQANVAKADSNRGGNAAPPEAKKPVAVMSAAQRIARQGTVARQNSAASANVPPPPASNPAPTMSAAERIQNQALVASAQKRGTTKAEVTEKVLADIKAKYKVFLANIDKEIAKLGPMYFVPTAKPAAATAAAPAVVAVEKSEEVADKVNGISTAEGEMVIEAQPSEPVPGMPFQATPVITTVPKRRARRKKKDTETA
jgi:hypothetical protein